MSQRAAERSPPSIAKRARMGTARYLEVEECSATADGRALFSDLSFSLDKGNLATLRGANGSGKSCLLHALCGATSFETSANAGSKDDAATDIEPRGIRLQARVRREHRPVARAEIASEAMLVAHHAPFLPSLSLFENLHFWASVFAPQAHEKNLRAAERAFALESFWHASLARLSAGERQRGALALLALKPQARLWLLDEPQVALDTQGKEMLYRYLLAHLEREGSAVIATHETLPSSLLKKVQCNLTLGEQGKVKQATQAKLESDNKRPFADSFAMAARSEPASLYASLYSSAKDSAKDSIRVCAALFMREWRLALRERGALWLSPAFVLLASATLAFALAPLALSSPVLYAANSGLLLFFACLLGLEGWLTREGESESLALYALCGQSWLAFVAAKFASFLVLRGLPAALATAGSVLFYPHLEIPLYLAFLLALPIAFLCVTALCAIGLFVATLTLHAQRRAENALLLALPLFLPPLLFAMSSFLASFRSGLSSHALAVPLATPSLQPSLLLLCGSLFFALALLPVCALLLGSDKRSP